MEKINVIINDEKYDFDKGITLLEIANKVYKEKFPAIVAFVDNELFSG